MATSTAPGTRKPLRRRRRLGDVEAKRAAALVDRLRPGRRVDDVDAAELRLAVAAVTDVIADERLAEPVRRIAAEVARTPEVAVAALDVVDRELPALDLVSRRRRGGFRFRHRVGPQEIVAHARGFDRR
jgi:hypothetical protein